MNRQDLEGIYKQLSISISTGRNTIALVALQPALQSQRPNFETLVLLSSQNIGSELIDSNSSYGDFGYRRGAGLGRRFPGSLTIFALALWIGLEGFSMLFWELWKFFGVRDYHRIQLRLAGSTGFSASWHLGKRLLIILQLMVFLSWPDGLG